MPTEKSERYRRGWEKLKEIDPAAGDRVVAAMKDVAPDLARYIVEFPFGDVYSREGLSLKERELITVSALCALGNARPQLKAHLHCALNVGWTRRELAEAIIQIAVYAGFPAAMNAAAAAQEVFAERDAKKPKN